MSKLAKHSESSKVAKHSESMRQYLDVPTDDMFMVLQPNPDHGMKSYKGKNACGGYWRMGRF